MTSRKHWTPERLPRLLVLDLDGVVWSERLAEDAESLTLDQSLIELLRELDRRGTLLTCVSKNNPDVARRALRDADIDQLLVASEIGFAPKAPAIARILQEVRIEASEAIFIDDTFRERKEVKQFLPDLRCLDPEQAKDLLLECLSNTSDIVTRDARLRKEHYAREKNRPFLRASSRAELSNLVASSALTVYVFKTTRRDLDRCAELYSRTHRLNFASRRRAVPELTELLRSDRYSLYSISVVDRYGPYGVVGCAVLRRDRRSLTIEDLVLSCRVQARRVEEAVLTDLINSASQQRLSHCSVRFVRTEHNSHLEAVLQDLSFRCEADREMWTRSTGHNGKGRGQRVILPTVIWDKPKLKNADGGIPFVQEELRRWAENAGFPTPIASVGSGYDDVLGENWERWLAPLGDSRSVTRIDIQPLPKTDIVDDAESLTSVPDRAFGTVLCLDMLEHTSRPWKVPPTVLRILRDGGVAVFSVPCMLGIHCEAMDLWRLTPVGLRHLLETTVGESDDRFRFRICGVWIEGTAAYPIRTLVIARKIENNDISCQ